MKDFRILIIGLGSMGKRRLRCLKNLQQKNVYGYDPRVDRTKEVFETYGIDVFNDFNKAFECSNPDVIIVSTPPQHHMQYAYFAQENNVNCFIEASVVDAEKIFGLGQNNNNNVLISPSCTKKFYPAPKIIKKLIENQSIGDVLNINYQKGQYLPDWHPWEDIDDYYVSNPDTGGAREIVPFELIWLNGIFGNPNPLTCVRRKLTDISADIDDIYHCCLEYPNNVLANISIEVISRPIDSNYIRILGSDGMIIFDGQNDYVKCINTKNNEWEKIYFKNELDQFNKSEQPYLDELECFLESVNFVRSNKPSIFPHTLEQDYKTLKVLHRLEEISSNGINLSK